MDVQVLGLFFMGMLIVRRVSKIASSSLVMFACPHAAVQLPQDGLSWRLIIEHFSTVVEKSEVSLKCD